MELEPLERRHSRRRNCHICATHHYCITKVDCGALSAHSDIIRRLNTGPRCVLPQALATDKELSDFLKSVEKRAFKRTAFAVRDDDSALDIVQDAMIRLAEKYIDRPAAELPLLFQRILSNATMDWFRRQKVRNAVMQNFSDFDASGEDGDFNILDMLDGLESSLSTQSASDAVSRDQVLLIIEQEVGSLPARQREAFLLRYWEELDVAETASVMGCSQGSVKTHCSRAVHALAKALKVKGIAP